MTRKNAKDAQWLPKPKQFCFCVNAAARPLCIHWTTKADVAAQQVVQMRQSGGRTIAKVAQVLPWSPNGGSVVATMIAQRTLLVGQRRHNGGTRKAETSLKLIHNVHNATHFYGATNDQPLCSHSKTTPMCLPSTCLLWATDLLGDLCATVSNMLKTSRRPSRPWRCLNVLCTTLERPRQPFGLLCKGGITRFSLGDDVFWQLQERQKASLYHVYIHGVIVSCRVQVLLDLR